MPLAWRRESPVRRGRKVTARHVDWRVRYPKGGECFRSVSWVPAVIQTLHKQGDRCRKCGFGMAR
jgi:hypothetical protein